MGSINCKRKKKETTSVSSLSIKQRREEDNSTNQTSPPPFSSHVHSERRVVEDGVVMKTNQASNDSDSSRQSSESSDQNGNESDEESSSGSASSCDEGGVSDHEQDKLNITLDDKVKEVLKGRLNFEMPEKVKIVRIFTSSTFTDTSVERNTLMVRVYPRIKKFCQERGYDFQVVDMRWGVRDESTDDHLTSELCMKELRACQRLSTGPNFITFLGQKYGYRPFPPKVPAVEFEKLFGAVDNNDDKNLLQRWFRRDDNSIPPQYLLQPISSVLPDYRNCGNSESRKKASSMWWTAFERMQIILRKSAEKVLNSEDRLKYFISVTEDEIYGGIITSPSPANNCLWFKRYISNLNESVESPKAGKFIDKMLVGTAETIDKEAQRHLKNLREKLSYVLPKTSIKLYDVKWNENGIDTNSSPEHARYITDLCETFFTTVTGMIENAVSERSAVEIEEPLTDEVIGHLSFCLKKCKAFHGREMFLKNVKETLKRDQHTIVIHGESGCGKTAIMAKVCTEVRQWFNQDDVIVVVRFIGTSPDSSNIRSLLRSICLQLCKLSGEDPREVPQEMKALVEYFPECLESATDSSHVVIVLDSLDQLSPDYGARQMDWLPKTLPKNVYLLLSTLPGEEYQCLTILKAKLPDECLKEVPKIPLTEADTILSKWLESASRSLTHIQSGLVMKAFQQCQLPIFLKLAFDEAIRWKSYSDDASTFLGSSVRFMINALLDRVERIHGNVLVGHALGYITASKNGLTETELEDLLSLDDDVLNDVYQYWTPPIRRLPPLLWIRIRSDIKDYLIDRGADGTRVIYWYHRQFIEVARERYLAGEEAKKIHAKMSEYFLGTWAGKKKPYVNKKGEKFSDDRLVATQPMMFDSSDEKPIFNLRKLSQLPYHLFNAEKYDTMKDEALCNFEFLLTKLRGTSVENILEDFSMYLSVLPSDPDVKIMHECLRLSIHPLSIEPKQFSTQLLGRMFKFQDRKEKYPYVCKILQQAKNASVPCFIPNNKFLTAPGGALVSTIALGSYGNECISIGNDNKTMALTYVASEGLEIKIIDYQSGQQLRKFTVTDPPSMYRITLNALSEKNKNLLLLAGGNTIFILNTETGQIVKQFEVDNDDWFSYNQKPPVSYADDENLLVAITRNSLRIWQVSDCKVVHDIPIKGVNVEEEIGNLDARGKYAVYNLKDQNTVHLVDLKQGKEVNKIKVKSGKINDLKVTKRDEVVVVPGSLDSLLIYDLHTANLVREVTTFKMMEGMGRVQITEDGTKALGIDMFEICTTNLLTGESERSLRSSVFRLKIFTRDGDTILSVSQDFILRVYDRSRESDDENQADTSVVEYQGNRIADQISSIAPGLDRRHVVAMATIQLTNHMSVWDCLTGKKVRQTKGMKVYPSAIRLIGDSTRGVGFIYHEKHPHYKVFNFKDGIIEKTLEGSACKRMNAFGMIDDNRMISFSRGRKNLKIWDINSGKVIDIIKFKEKNLFQEMILNPDGKVAVLSVSSTSETYPENTTMPLYVYNTTNKQHKVLTIKNTVLSLYNAAISDNGKYLVCIAEYTTPYLFNLETGEVKCKLLKPDSYESSMTGAISTVTNVVVTGIGQGGLNVWDLNTGAILRTIPCDSVTNVYLSADGEVVFARDSRSSNTFNSWDVNSGRKLATITTDGFPTQVHIVGDRLVMAIGESPNLMVMRLHIPGKIQTTDALSPSPFDGLPLDAELKDLSNKFTEKDPMDHDKYDSGSVM